MANATAGWKIPRPPVPILLVHGMWCTAQNWSRIVSTLQARGYPCHAPTLPAHTPTPDQPLQVGALSLTDYLGFLEAELDALGGETPPVIIGHSMGGLLAQQLAARRPCTALILLTPALPWGMNILSWSNLRAFFRHFLRWGFWRRSHKLDRDMASWAAFNGIPADRHERLYDGMVHESGRAAFELALWWADWRRAARVPPGTVRCPVYVVTAGQDRLTPSRRLRKLRRRYPQARFRHYPDRGHWVIDDEQTDEMINGILSWLRPHESRLRAPVPPAPGVAA